MRGIAFIITLTSMIFIQHAALASPVAGQGRTVVIDLAGKVDDWQRDAMEHRFAQARQLGATTVILRIDTYGGLVTSALDMSRFIKQQTNLHTIALVHNTAISAGAMIAMACDEIVMEPSSMIGDCAPISIKEDGTLDALPPAERAKQESPILADFRDSAIRNHHDVLVAEAMVSVDRTVHCLRDDSGTLHFVDSAGVANATTNGWKPADGIRDPLDTANELLTLSADVATKIGLAKEISNDSTALAAARNFDVVATLTPSAGDWVIEALASPIARWIFIIAFALSVKTAFSIPGHGLAEAIALISFGLLLGMPFLIGTAQWWEIAMVVGGLALVAFEVFVLPGHFVSGVAGVLMMVTGLTLTFVGREPGGPGYFPNLPTTYRALETGLTVVTAGLICSMLLWVWLNRYLPQLPYFNRLVLHPPGGDSTMMGALGSDIVWPLVGTIGLAVTELKPGGSAQFVDESINGERPISVISDAGFISAGKNIVVTESRGTRVVVRPI